MENKVDGATWIRVTVIVAIIGCLGTLGAAIIGISPDIFSATSPEEHSSKFINGLIDVFEGKDGTYDKSVWDCENECDDEYVLVENGNLIIQRNQEGWTNLVSHNLWSYKEIASLEGKIKITKGSNLIAGWFGFHRDASCDINGIDSPSPFIRCYFGSDSNREYTSADTLIDFDTWYIIKITPNYDSRTIKYYLDNVLIGEHSPSAFSDTAQIALGVWSPGSIEINSVFIDDVRLILKK